MKQHVWIGLREAVAIHARALTIYGGAAGLRDEGLLESALARPRQIHAYARSTVHSLAAAYAAGIIRNHPFVDGNKRVGFVVGILFLELNGYRFDASEESAAQAVLSLAEGSLEEDGYAAFLSANSKRAR